MAKDKPEGSPERTFTQDDVDRIVGERLTRDRQTRVLSEPRVYALASPNSYYLDSIQARLDPQGLTYPSAHERLNRYGVELAHEIENRSAEGRRAERVLREHTRMPEPDQHERRFKAAVREIRALTTGGGTTASGAGGGAAALVAPAFLMDDYALFRDNYRTFADQCHILPLPEFGTQVYLPYFITGDAASQQTELAGVTETDPTTGLQNSPVVTIDGQVTITQQLNDRFGGGGGADVIFNRQLRQHLAAKLDVFALNQVISGGASVAGASTFGVNTFGNFLSDLSKGRQQLTDTAGVRLRPTHLFTTYDLYSFVSDQVSSTGSPLVTITETPGAPIVGYPVPTGADDGLNGGSSMPKWARFTGAVLPGSVLWFTDDNIPASGANTQLIVSAPDQAVIVMESPEPVLQVFPQTFAGSLAIVVSLYEYASVITRHASGSAIITGNAYPTSARS